MCFDTVPTPAAGAVHHLLNGCTYPYYKIQHLDRHIVGRLCRAFRIDLYRLQVAVEG